MAMVITANTFPLTTPRTTEQTGNPVQTLMTRFATLCAFDGGTHLDHGKADQLAQRLRGLMKAQPGDHASPTGAAWEETIGAVMTPVRVMRRREAPRGLAWSHLVTAQPTPTASLTL